MSPRKVLRRVAKAAVKQKGNVHLAALAKEKFLVYRNEGRYSTIRSEYAMLRQSGVTPFASTLSLTLASCLHGSAGSALGFFEDFKRLNYEPRYPNYDVLIRCLIRDNQTSKALEYFHEMRTRGFVPDSDLWRDLIGACDKDALHNECIELFEGMQSLGITPRIATIHGALRSYTALRKLQRITDLSVKLLTLKRTKLNISSYTAMLRGLSLGPVTDFMLSCLQRLLDDDITIGRHFSLDVAKACAICERPNYALRFLEKSAASGMKIGADDLLIASSEANLDYLIDEVRILNENPTTPGLSDIVSHSLKTNRKEDCLKLYRLSESLQVPLLTGAYVSVLKACRVNGDLRLFEKVWSGIKRPDVAAYTEGLLTLSTMGYVDYSRSELIELINSDNQKLIDCALLNALQCSYYALGFSDFAQEVCSLRTKLGFKKDSSYYVSALREARLSGDFQRAEEYFGTLVTNKVFPDVRIVTEMILLSAKDSRFSRCVELFNDYIAEGVKPSLHMYNTMIRVYASMRQFANCLKLFQSMKVFGVQPDIITFSSLLVACEKSKKYNEAMDLVQEMKQLDIIPNRFIYTQLISVCTSSGNFAESAKIFKAMHALGIGPNVVTYSAMINSYSKARDSDAAIQLFNQMEEHHLKPNDIIYSTLLSACGRSNHFEDAYAIFRQMKIRGVAPSTRTYNVMLYIYAQAEDVTLALPLFNSMSKNGLIPNRTTYNALAFACESIQDRRVGHKYYKMALESGIFRDVYDGDTIVLSGVSNSLMKWILRYEISQAKARNKHSLSIKVTARTAEQAAYVTNTQLSDFIANDYPNLVLEHPFGDEEYHTLSNI